MEPTKNNFRWLRFVAALLSIYACASPGLSWAQTAYYQGKTLTILRGGTPGGYGDLQARALIPYLKKYIPGEPTIIIEHKQGAAGRTAVNYIYSGAKPDGLTIGAVGNVLVSGPILGLAGSNYDLDKLIYLGSTESGSPTAFVTPLWKRCTFTPSLPCPKADTFHPIRALLPRSIALLRARRSIGC